MTQKQSNEKPRNQSFIRKRISFLIFSVCLMTLILNQHTETISVSAEYIGTPKHEITSYEISGREDTWILTAYCPCNYCSNGHTTASGEYATEGRTVAAGGMYKFGTQILIEGMGLYTVEDRFGGPVNSHRGDIFFESHQDAVNFGRQKRRVLILE